MNILVLGGTKFVGRALVEAASSAGHQVTLFNRGKSNPNLFSYAENLKGDRDGDLSALQGRSWDVAIDTCGYVPRVVRQSAEVLRDAVPRYVFISTISVYDNGARDAEDIINERFPLKLIEDETTEEINAYTYGALKVLCEREVDKCFAGRSLLVRPGVIVGPHDPTDRFTYWALRATQAGDALAPQPPERRLQFIDARDLAAWTIAGCENDLTGVFNAVGPAEALSMEEFLCACVEVAGKHTTNSANPANFVWTDEAFLAQSQVSFWSELPLCIAPSDGKTVSMNFDSSKAISAGLAFRPLEETIADTLTWAGQRPPGYQLRAGLTSQKELKLLKTWLQSQSQRQSQRQSR